MKGFCLISKWRWWGEEAYFEGFRLKGKPGYRRTPATALLLSSLCHSCWDWLVLSPPHQKWLLDSALVQSWQCAAWLRQGSVCLPSQKARQEGWLLTLFRTGVQIGTRPQFRLYHLTVFLPLTRNLALLSLDFICKIACNVYTIEWSDDEDDSKGLCNIYYMARMTILNIYLNTSMPIWLSVGLSQSLSTSLSLSLSQSSIIFNYPVRQILLLSPSYRWKTWGSEVFRNVPQDTEPS